MNKRPKLFQEILNEYVIEVEKLRERKRCLGTGEKSTNIEIQIDNTIARYDKRIKSLSALQGTSMRKLP